MSSKRTDLDLPCIYMVVIVTFKSYLSLQVDVIVNNSSDKFQLSSGGASLALYQKAGATIQQECTNNIPNPCHAGDIVVTSGGSLSGVSFIFHGHCGSWDGGKVKLVVRS